MRLLMTHSPLLTRGAWPRDEARISPSIESVIFSKAAVTEIRFSFSP
jgi:hypothetical protein